MPVIIINNIDNCELHVSLNENIQKYCTVSTSYPHYATLFNDDDNNNNNNTKNNSYDNCRNKTKLNI